MLTILVGMLACCLAAIARDGRNDLEEHNLKGKVKQVRTKIYYVDSGDTSLNWDIIATYDIHGNTICDSDCRDTSWIIRYKNKYDNQGKILEKQQLDRAEKRPDWRTTYTYDAKGWLKETNRYKDDGELMQRVVFIYDADGKNVKQVSYGSDGKKNGSTELAYNDNGLLIQEVNYGGFYGDDALRDSVAYDDKGNLKVRKEYDGKREVIKKQEGTYTDLDKNGNYLRTTEKVSRKDGINYVRLYVSEITYY